MLCGGALGDEIQGFFVAVTGIVNGYLLDFSRSEQW